MDEGLEKVSGATVPGTLSDMGSISAGSMTLTAARSPGEAGREAAPAAPHRCV